jgi:hypothetical protein
MRLNVLNRPLSQLILPIGTVTVAGNCGSINRGGRGPAELSVRSPISLPAATYRRVPESQWGGCQHANWENTFPANPGHCAGFCHSVPSL